MVIYLDLVMILNFCVDFFLLMGTNRLSGYPADGKRAAVSALVGAVYAGACVLPEFRFLSNLLWRVVSLLMMGVLAFGWGKNAIRRTILFVFLSMALGGIALGLGSGGFWAIVMGALGVCILCVMGFGGVVGQRYLPVRISHGGREIQLTALVDTGNMLRDPISGRPVVVADATAAAKLLGLTDQQLRHPAETVASRSVAGLRLIPYHAVGQPGGMLLAVKADCLSIGGREENCLVAFAPQEIGRGKDYQALVGGIAG